MELMNDLIIDDEFFRCELNPEIPVLVHRWLKKPSSGDFKAGLLEIQRVFNEKKKDYPELKWLADTELLGELTEDDEKWLEETWDKLLFEESGLKVHAVILGNDIYADYSMEEFKRNADKVYSNKGIKLGIFLNSESADERRRES